MHRKDFSKGSFSSSLAPLTRPSPTSRESQGDDFAIAFGEGSPTFSGLYHRSQSTDIQNIPPLNLGSSPPADDQRSIHSLRSSSGDASASARTEKNGWLKGDLSTSRSLIIHANPSQSGGVSNLDLRKGGFVAGLGAWRFSATSDVVSITMRRIVGRTAGLTALAVLDIRRDLPFSRLPLPQSKYDHLLRPPPPCSDLHPHLTTHTQQRSTSARRDQDSPSVPGRRPA